MSVCLLAGPSLASAMKLYVRRSRVRRRGMVMVVSVSPAGVHSFYHSSLLFTRDNIAPKAAGVGKSSEWFEQCNCEEPLMNY